MSRFDRIILATVLGLAVVIGGLSFESIRLGPTVDKLATVHTFDGTSVNTQIAITFTAKMDRRSVQSAFQLTPQVAGDFSWTASQFFFRPRTPLAYGTSYTLRIGTKAHDTSGKPLSHPFTAQFATQVQHLLYRGISGSERGHLVLASVNGVKQTVPGTSSFVTDFSTSFDRSLVVYVRRGNAGERPDELWLLSLDDNSTQRLFRRTDWTLDQVHLSPDGRYVAFLATNVRLCQQYYGCHRDSNRPVIYLFDMRTRKVTPFQSSKDVPLTNFLTFSPVGDLAFTDLGSALTVASPHGTKIVHIPNRGNSLEFTGFDVSGSKAVFVGQTSSSSGGDILVYSGSTYQDVSRGVYDSASPSFASRSDNLAYAAYRGELGIEPLYGINVYRYKDGHTLHVTAERRWSDWSPRWSPDDRYIAFLRSPPQEAMYMGSGEIWVTGTSGTRSHPLGAMGTSIQWVT